jgi:hypothetical protein
MNRTRGAVYRLGKTLPMPSPTSFLPLAALILHLPASAQVSGNLWYDENTRIFFQQAEQPVKATVQGNMLVLEVNAMMNARADSYMAIFHLSQVGQSAEEADSLMTTRIDGLLDRMKREKLKVDDVFVDMLSFVPVFEYETLRKGFSKHYQEIPGGLRDPEEHPHPFQRPAHSGPAGDRRRQGGDLRPGEDGLLCG